MSLLIVFGGLPGVGKSTLARAMAQAHAAAYLRIDVIEQSLRSSGSLAGDVGPAGYVIGYALAESNLRLGRPVVADSVNPLGITRDAWRGVAAAAGVDVMEIEVICSDQVEHRRRIETRLGDVPGLVLPDWQAVVNRNYEAWDRGQIVIDTAGCTEAEAITALLRRLPAPLPHRR